MLLPVLSASPVWRALPLWLFHNCAIDDDDDDDVGGWCYVPWTNRPPAHNHTPSSLPRHLTIPRTTSLIFSTPHVHHQPNRHSIIPAFPHPLSQRIVSSFSSTSPENSTGLPCRTLPVVSFPHFPVLYHRLHPQPQPSSKSHLRSDMQVAHSYPLLPPNWNPAFPL